MRQRIFISVIIVVFAVGSCVNDSGSINCEAPANPPPPPEVTGCNNVQSDAWKSLGLESESVTAVAAHADHEGLLLAGTQSNFSDGTIGKLYRSTDCGQTWQVEIEGGNFRQIAFDPQNPNIVYAVNGSVLKSTDYGASWVATAEGIALDAEIGVTSIAINPRQPCLLYAGTEGFGKGSMYKSTDAGERWKELKSTGLDKNYLENGVGNLAIDPANPQSIYVGVGFSGDIIKSTNGGATWQTTRLTGTGQSVDVLKVYPQTQTIYAGIRFTGLYLAEIGEENKEWEYVSLPDSVDAILDITYLPNQDKLVYASSNGVFTLNENQEFLSYSSGLSKNDNIETIDRVKSKALIIGLRKFDGIPGGIYIRKH